MKQMGAGGANYLMLKATFAITVLYTYEFASSW